MTDIQLPEAPATEVEAVTGTLRFDAGKYREHVDDLDLTEEQKAELLKTLWWIMATFVDLGFRVDSVQYLLPAFAEAASNRDSGALRVEDEDCRPSFAGAAKQKEPKHEL
jgi:hypothetical protein